MLADLGFLLARFPEQKELVHGFDLDVHLADETLEHVFWVIPEEQRLTTDDADHWYGVYARMLALRL